MSLLREKNKKQKSIIYLPADATITLWQKWIEYFFSPLSKVNKNRFIIFRFLRALYRYLKFLPRQISSFLGQEIFYYPVSRKILEKISQNPDIIHAHNLHGNYFDLRICPYYSQKIPFLITMHDNWLLTGHCACFFDCKRWTTGCGRCPDLNIYPAIKRDATAFNWNRKRKIYAKSKLYIAAPSQWMIDCLDKSMLYPYVRKAKVVPNGIDILKFKPQNKMQLRRELDLPQNAYIFTFVANNPTKNPFKDYDTLLRSLYFLNKKTRKKVLYLAVGMTEQDDLDKDVAIKAIPYIKDQAELAKYYSLSDVYLHAAKAENFPLTILEALSCGIPVITTAVGGIPEIIENGKNGFLVAKGDAKDMAEKALKLIMNKELYKKCSLQARKDASEKYSLEKMSRAYLDYYDEIINDFQNNYHN